MFMSLRRLISPFFLAAALCAVVVSGCTKYAPYEGETFECECGMLEWDGRELGMRMAEVESLSNTVTTSSPMFGQLPRSRPVQSPGIWC